MNSASSLDRHALRRLTICAITAVLFGGLAGIATTIISRTVKTISRNIGGATRATTGR